MKVATPDVVACTGATTAGFFNAQSPDTGPQWRPSMGRFDLVSFSFGGDDVGFKPIIEACYKHNALDNKCTDDYVRPRIAQLAKTYPDFLERVARTTVTRGGNVVVMGYPELVEDPNLWPLVNRVTHACQIDLSTNAGNLVRGWAGDINATMGYAVKQANKAPAASRNHVTFTFVDPVSGNDGVSPTDSDLYEPASGTRHELCSDGDQNWINGVTIHPIAGLGPGWITVFDGVAHVGVEIEPSSFHPTQAGENAVGHLAAEIIAKLTWPWTTASSGTTVSVTTCPTTFGVTPPSTTIPSLVTVEQSLGGLQPMALYVDRAGYTAVLAPAGWTCSAEVGADGTTNLTVDQPATTSAAPDEYIDAYDIPACVGCQYGLSCGLFPSANETHSPFYGPCPIDSGTDEAHALVNPEVATFAVAPSTNGGDWNNSTSPYTANGVMYDIPGGTTSNTVVGEAVCVLPDPGHSTCTAILNQVVADDGQPPWTNTH